MIDEKTLCNLEVLYREAREASDTFKEAVKVQAAEHQQDATGLRQYVVARANDKLDALKRRQMTLDLLVDGVER